MMFNAYRDFADDSGRKIAAPTSSRPRIVLNANRRVPHAAPSFDPTRNVRANGSNRSYSYTTVSDSLVIEYGPHIFANLSKPRGTARFA
jgi:hypothetical protein